MIRGRDAYRRFFERTFDTWERFVAEVDELVDAGDAVVALVRISGGGEGQPGGRGGAGGSRHMAARRPALPVKVFADRDDALRAAGLTT